MLPNMTPNIARHKTAIRRHDLSLPVKCLLRDGLINTNTTVFDYGCGHGENVELLNGKAISCSGWDPAFCPDTPLVRSDIVNLGYVINVIEDISERGRALQRAWSLAVFAISASRSWTVSSRGWARFKSTLRRVS